MRGSRHIRKYEIGWLENTFITQPESCHAKRCIIALCVYTANGVLDDHTHALCLNGVVNLPKGGR